ERLVALYRKIMDQPWSTHVELETIESPKVKKVPIQGTERLLDDELFEELKQVSSTEVAKLSSRESAMLALHLLLDSKLYLARELESPPPPPPTLPLPPKTKSVV